MAQGEPRLEVLGVYRMTHMDAALRSQPRIFYSSGNAVWERSNEVYKYIDRCVPLVLFELLLDDLDDSFSMKDFTQAAPKLPRKC